MTDSSKAEFPFDEPASRQDPWKPALRDPYAVGQESEGGLVQLPPPPQPQPNTPGV
jgi:hypothetical protein